MGGFGQFAFGHKHTLPAFDVDPSSFVAHAPNAFPISLGPERTGIVIESLSRFGKTIALRPSGNAPVKIDYEATSLGFTLRYVNGMQWTAENEEPPFITWSEGTVGPGVPSAPSSWALLTWRGERPPLLLVFSNPVGLSSVKTDTGFSLSTGRWSGNVSVRLPFGKRTAATVQASDFGGLLQELRPLLDYIAAPVALSAAVTPHAEGYEIAVKFDRPGAAVPPAAVFAIASGIARLLTPTLESGPKDMPICSTDELRILIRAPGPFAAGSPIVYRAGTRTTTSSGAENRLLAYLTGNATSAESRALSFLPPLQTMITQANTGIGMPMAPDGSGSYRAALRGLEFLAQGRPAPFLDSVFAGVDWVTWQPPGGTAAERADAAAALAIAGPFCQSVDNRALAAMANAAISFPTGWDDVRHALYSNAEKPSWLEAVRSPLRILTPGVSATDAPNGFKVFGAVESIESFELKLKSDQPLVTAASENIDRTLVTGIGETTTIKVWPKSIGEWSLTFRRSAAGNPIPRAVPSPRYNAVQR
jgi:hypothetical protein